MRSHGHGLLSFSTGLYTRRTCIRAPALPTERAFADQHGPRDLLQRSTAARLPPAEWRGKLERTDLPEAVVSARRAIGHGRPALGLELLDDLLLKLGLLGRRRRLADPAFGGSRPLVWTGVGRRRRVDELEGLDALAVTREVEDPDPAIEAVRRVSAKCMTALLQSGRTWAGRSQSRSSRRPSTSRSPGGARSSSARAGDRGR